MSSPRCDDRFNGGRGCLFGANDETGSLHPDIAHVTVPSGGGMWNTAQSVAV
jgi:hypothetical protein